MKLFEMHASVDEHGSIILPAELLGTAGLIPGDEMIVTLAVKQEKTKTFSPQLVITPHGLEVALQITGWEGDNSLCVSVTPDPAEAEDILDNLPNDLRELFNMLGIDPGVVREVMRKEGYFV